MNGKLTHRDVYWRQRTRLIGFICAVAAILGWAGMQIRALCRHQPPYAARTVKAVRNRAEEICRALGNTCEIDSEPVFTARSRRCYPGDNIPLKIWKFMCRIDGRTTWMMFNDETGSLCCLVSAPTDRRDASKGGLRVIATRREAAEAGFQHLKSMRLLPHNALIALYEPPHLAAAGTLWEMAWNIKQEPALKPYVIRLTLRQEDGVPFALTDMSQLRQR
jgi:hypothetical protein